MSLSSLRLPILLGLLLAAALCVSAAQALEFPALTDRVVDNANLLSSQQESALTAQLASHEEATSNQVVVVTLPSLQGTTIDDFGYQLGRHWGIGQAGRDNGVLLIVAPNERKVRIEVGYGLEGDLPDAIARAIIDQEILPAFRRDDYPGGIEAGVGAIILAIEGAYEPQKKKPNRFGWLPILFIALIFGTMVFHYFLDNFDRKDGRWVRRKRPRRRSGTFYGFGGSRGSSGSSGGGGFSGGGGSFGGGGSSGSW